ncbi:hypothetical protein BaRGS_00039378, partial [Batillaria attramentaria]
HRVTCHFFPKTKTGGHVYQKDNTEISELQVGDLVNGNYGNGLVEATPAWYCLSFSHVTVPLSTIETTLHSVTRPVEKWHREHGNGLVEISQASWCLILTDPPSNGYKFPTLI